MIALDCLTRATSPLRGLFRRDDLLNEKFALDEGALMAPQRPALGVRINAHVLAKYTAQR